MEITDLYRLFKLSSGVATDTRKVSKDKLYFALKGANFNGNNFALEAIDKGAMCSIVDEPIEGEKIILVDNVLETLQKLARYHRSQFDIPILAITGSNGKTTTKELIANVLKQKYRVLFTQGNLNNHIGVPLTLLTINAQIEIAIIEMGANHQGEIAELCKIALPTHGLITNIGNAHLEGFGGIEGVKKGKLELFDYLKLMDGVFFQNLNDERLTGLKGILIKTYEKFENVSSAVYPLEFFVDKYLVRSYLFGDYNLSNLSAANEIGEYFEVNTLDRCFGLESYIPENNRSQIISWNNCTIILDAYNANPSSMLISLKNFNELEGKKIVVLGSMKELGEYSVQHHQELVAQVDKCSFEMAFFIGEEFSDLKMPSNSHFYKSMNEMKDNFDLHQFSNFLILLKGSRSNAIESLIN